METPLKPTKTLEENLSTAAHQQSDTKDQPNQDQTPVDYEHQDDLKLQQIENEIQQIGGQLQELSHRIKLIEQQDRQNGKFSEEYLELEFDRCNLRKRLLDLDFTHKEINYPRLYAKKKKEELQYERIQKQHREKQNHSPSVSFHVLHLEKSQELRRTPQFEQEVISQRPSEERDESTNHHQLRHFDNSAVKFNLSESQNPYNTSIHNFGFDKINQVESSQFVRSNPNKKIQYKNFNGKPFERYQYMKPYEELINMRNYKITYLEERRRIIQDEIYQANLREIYRLENDAKDLHHIDRISSILHSPIKTYQSRRYSHRLYDPSLKIFLY